VSEIVCPNCGDDDHLSGDRLGSLLELMQQLGTRGMTGSQKWADHPPFIRRGGG
jgi:hypothetical protein